MKKTAAYIFALFALVATAVLPDLSFRPAPAARAPERPDAPARSLMPPLDESRMGAYLKFESALGKGASKTASAHGPAPRSLAESRPYEQLRPAEGVHNVVAILVDFDDRPYYSLDKKYRTPAYYEDLALGSETRSMKRYYREVSRGRLDFAGKVLPAGAGQGISSCWFRSPTPYSHYGRDRVSFEDVDASDISRLAEEAIRNAAGYTDFSKYDTDRDGIVSPYELHIVIFHSGSGQEKSGDASDIWSHRFSLASPVRTRGVVVEGYLMMAHDSPLGVLCHEMGHDLGLFDIYDTFTGKSVLGSWSLMDRGAWNGDYPRSPGDTPAYPSAYERMILGWIKPAQVGSETRKVDIAAASNAGAPEAESAVRIEVPGTSGKEYLLFENRYKVSGTFDEGAPPRLQRENGILVYHVDERMPDRTYYGYANDSRNSHYRVELARTRYAEIENSYYLDGFSRYSSKLETFDDGTGNAFRMNCPGPSLPVNRVEFNRPFPAISGYEVGVSGDMLFARLSLKSFNPQSTRYSAVLVHELSSSQSGRKYYSEIPLVESAPVEKALVENGFDLDLLGVIDGREYYVRFTVSDGEYSFDVRTAGFTVLGVKSRALVVEPPEINTGEVQVGVVFSETVNYYMETESVTISYISRAAGGWTSQSLPEGRLTSVKSGVYQRPARIYSFGVTEDFLSPVKIAARSSLTGEIVTAEVSVVRTAPDIRSGVYYSSDAPGVLTFVVESDRRLLQAQLSIREDGPGTTSISMFRRPGTAGNYYYYNYRVSSAAVSPVSYRITCADRAGNVVSAGSGAAGTLHPFHFAGGSAALEVDGGSLLISSKTGPPGRTRGFASASTRRAGLIELRIMPDAPAQENGAVTRNAAIRLTPKLAGRAISRVVRESAGGEAIYPSADGACALESTGTYAIYTAAPAPRAPAPRSFAAFPNPAASLASFARSGGFSGRLSVYDSAGRLALRSEDYQGGAVDVSDLARGTYFFVLRDADGEYRGKLAIIR